MFREKTALDTRMGFWDTPRPCRQAACRLHPLLSSLFIWNGGSAVNRARLTLGICCLLCTVLANSAAAEDHWKLPNLNPFKKSEKRTTSTSQNGLKLSKLGTTPNSGLSSRKRSNEPSTWSKVTQGTKGFFSKTYDVLTPWDTEAEKAQARKARSPALFSNTGSNKKPEKKAFLTGWLHDEEEPRQPQTVSEWLAQPRP